MSHSYKWTLLWHQTIERFMTLTHTQTEKKTSERMENKSNCVFINRLPNISAVVNALHVFAIKNKMELNSMVGECGNKAETIEYIGWNEMLTKTAIRMHAHRSHIAYRTGKYNDHTRKQASIHSTHTKPSTSISIHTWSVCKSGNLDECWTAANFTIYIEKCVIQTGINPESIWIHLCLLMLEK